MVVIYATTFVILGSLFDDDSSVASRALQGLVTGVAVTAFLLWMERRKAAQADSAGGDGA